MPHIKIDCKKFKDYLGNEDQRKNKILLSDDENFSYIGKLKALLDKFEGLEISLLINMQSEIKCELIELCRRHRLIVYLDFSNDILAWQVKPLEGIDLVLFATYHQLRSLSNEQIEYIIKADLNVCLVNISGELQEIEDLYNRFLSMGFSKLFKLAYTKMSKENGQLFDGLIDRSDLETFFYKQNLNVANQITLLQKNALRRFNRSRTTTKAEKQDIVLIDLECQVNSFKRKNLGIEYLASVLKSANYKVITQYCNRHTFINEFDAIYHTNEIKVVGFSCMQDNCYAIKNAISHIKDFYPEIICFVGGAQAISLGEEFIRETSTDYIMVGESENCIVDLMRYVLQHKGSLRDIGNIRYLNEKNVYVENDSIELISNLDEIPFPNYVFEIDDQMIVAGVITGRGCPYKCAFCFEGEKEKTVRYRSVSNVMEEISVIIKNKKNIKRIQFYDDTFTLSAQRTLEFCKYMKELKVSHDISWICEMHCQTVYDKPDLIKNMVDSGLRGAQIGLESGNNSILKRLNKQTTLEMILKTVENCKLFGLNMLEGNILLGGSGETEEDLDYNLTFVRQLLNTGKGMFELNVVPFWPFDNTPISRQPEKYGVKIIPKQCENSIFSISNFVSESESVSRQQFMEHYKLLNRKIEEIYEELALTLSVEEAEKHQVDGYIIRETKWGRALSSYQHIVTYFKAKAKVGNVAINNSVIPIRTFDMLFYNNNKLCTPGFDSTFDVLDSEILECSNGKNTFFDIATKLKIGNDVLASRLKALENKMFLYFSTL